MIRIPLERLYLPYEDYPQLYILGEAALLVLIYTCNFGICGGVHLVNIELDGIALYTLEMPPGLNT